MNDRPPEWRTNRPQHGPGVRWPTPSGPWPRPGKTTGRHPRLCTIVQMDVAGSARRDGRSLEQMRNDLFDLVESVALRGEINLETPPYEDTGDGLRLLLPADIPPTRAIEVFAGGLAAGLHEHRRKVDAAARIRLRVAFHIGLVTRHRGSWTGSSLVVAARLVNSKPLRAALRVDDKVNLAAAVSDPMYQLVVRDRFGHIPVTCYRKIRVRVKEYDDRAWLLVPRSACVCALPDHGCAAHEAGAGRVETASRKGRRR
jgi:hypothetical protein